MPIGRENSTTRSRSLSSVCAFFAYEPKDPYPFDVVLVLELVPHAPQLLQYPGSVLHMLSGRYGHFPYMSDMAGRRDRR